MPRVAVYRLVWLLASSISVGSYAQPDSLPPEPAPYGIDADRIFYVEVWGSPSVTWQLNSPVTPFGSLEHARQQVRLYKATLPPGKEERIEVRFGGGVYY